jgi:hypothetical protein
MPNNEDQQEANQPSTEEAASSTKYTFKDNSFSGNTGNITIADKIKNQYKTVNKVIRSNPVIGILLILLFIAGIVLGGYVTPYTTPVGIPKTKPNNTTEPSNDAPAKIPPQREITKFEKTTLEYFLEATSRNFDPKKLALFGACQADESYHPPRLFCNLIHYEFDAQSNVTAETPKFITKTGSYYIGSDTANYASEATIFILVEPAKISATDNSQPMESNLFKFKVTSNDKGELQVISVDNAIDVNGEHYHQFYHFNDFLSSQIGQQITTTENLDWREVKVTSKTKFQ